jgi:hypothetical protein
LRVVALLVVLAAAVVPVVVDKNEEVAGSCVATVLLADVAALSYCDARVGCASRSNHID